MPASGIAPTRLCVSMIVERPHISLPRLRAQFAGTTVAIIADLHGGASAIPQDHLPRAVEIVRGLNADLIVLLGDMVHAPKFARQHVQLLAGLEAPLGVWACLGNHEHGMVWYNRRGGRPWPGPTIEEWRVILAEVGIGLLVNEARPLLRDGARMWIAGVDDAYSLKDDLAAALREVPPGECCLAITHSPDVVDDPRISDVDLILAGHTHGGQIRWPLIGPLCAPCRKPRERWAGFTKTPGGHLYVSRGAGEGLPLRIRCPREVTLLTLDGPQGI